MPHSITQNEWTIVFLIYADLRDNLFTEQAKRELKALFAELRATKKSNKVDILVVYNVIRPLRDRDQDVSYVYKLTTETNRKGFRLRMAFKPFRTPAFLQKTGHLTSLMKKLFYRYKAKKHMLFTWNHGSIFGIFRIEKAVNSGDDNKLKEDCRYLYEDGRYLYFAKKNKPHKRQWDTDLNQHNNNEEVNELLTNEELATIIARSIPGRKKLDILIMMNCFVQNIYAAYALHKIVGLLIGPQGAIDEPGYNYRFIFDTVMNRPFIKPVKLMHLMISSIEKLGTTPDILKEINTWAILGTSLNIIPMAIELLDELGNFLADFITNKDILHQIEDMRNIRLFHFDSFRKTEYLIDLKNLIQQLQLITQTEEFTRFEKTITYIESAFCKAKFLGTNHYILNDGSNFTTTNTPPTGISIYFPRTKQGIANDDFLLLNKAALTTKVPKWTTFIDKYLTLTSNN